MYNGISEMAMKGKNWSLICIYEYTGWQMKNIVAERTETAAKVPQQLSNIYMSGHLRMNVHVFIGGIKIRNSFSSATETF